jgi:hypothetical protein
VAPPSPQWGGRGGRTVGRCPNFLVSRGLEFSREFAGGERKTLGPVGAGRVFLASSGSLTGEPAPVKRPMRVPDRVFISMPGGVYAVSPQVGIAG